MTNPTDRPGHPIRQFRVDNNTWRAFMNLAGDKAGGTTLRRLIALYLSADVPGDYLRAKVTKTPDPSPDRRPRTPRS